MDNSKLSKKGKLLFEFYSIGDSRKEINSDLKEKKITKLKQINVKTIFIITSNMVDLDSYSQFVEEYEKEEFRVKSYHIDHLKKKDLKYIHNIVDDINECFLNKESCLIVSYGKSFAGSIISCFFIHTGKEIDDAIEKVKGINSSLIDNKDEISFIQDFANYIKSIQNKAPSDEESILERDESCNSLSSLKHKRRESDTAIQPSKMLDTSIYKPLKFYNTIRFKLITIISFILIFALCGMILLATHFFKNDNVIRVQENNLKISEIISLKIKSDLISLINKSRIIVNVIQQNISKKNTEHYSKLMLNKDKDIIFLGIAHNKKKRVSHLKFIKSTYNISLTKEIQISKDDIKATHKKFFKIFFRSFDGETVVHNLSQAFNLPVIGISFPFQRDIKRRRSIIVSYIRLDKFLKAFKSSGITKTFMINEYGDIIAHSDSKIVISGGNYINLPIVKMMIKSTIDNGQTRYTDEDGIYHLGSFKKVGIGGCGVVATVEENRALQEVYNMQRRNIYLMIIILTIAVLIVYFFGKTITTPIINLVGATKKIKEGEYRVDIKPATKDEIGELTNAFIEMGKGLEEREKIKSAFGKFVNPELAELVVKDEISLGGEKKSVVVLFSDIRSFTTISENLEPEEVVEFLNEYMTKMVECIDKTGGVVDKFIGDAIMAVWGVPVSKGNETENAINGALFMRRALIEFNKNRGGPKTPKIHFGCGISTGPVLAGQIGSENRMEYTVIGDTVNLAARIESLNKQFGTDILISEDSYNCVKDKFKIERMSPIKVKGKENPQQIYAVLGNSKDHKCPNSIEELRGILGINDPLHQSMNDFD